MKMLENVNLAELTTFRMGPVAKHFVSVENVNEIREAYQFAQTNNLPVVILGGGSNVVIDDSKQLNALVIQINLKGFEVLEESFDTVLLKIGAGENWDAVVSRVVEMGLWGIEALSWIPGTVGATPIQNVGAYGREIADVLVSLDAYDINLGTVRQFTNIECKFTYRDSIFKKEMKGKCVISSITVKLSKQSGQMPNYPGVKNYFEQKGISEPTLLQIREAIIDIRNKKLPHPKEVASVGSFFKNPIVSTEQYEKLREKYAKLVAFPVDGGQFKIGAGWLLENLGVKGKLIGHLQFYPNNALVLVNTGDASFVELATLIKEIQQKVKEIYGIDLEPEPVFIT